MNSLPIFSALLLQGVLVLSVRGGELKVDINRDSKNSLTETETGYTRWSTDTTGGASAGLGAIIKSFTTATGEAVTVTFAQTALSQTRGGTGLLSNWYQVGAQGSTAKLVSDGITVAPATLSTGGQILMTLTGLSAGPHTLLTYHNAWDGLAAGSMGPMEVAVNGVLSVATLVPSIRTTSNSLAPVSYVEFNVSGPTAVTEVLFSALTTGSAARKNVVINGFEIDTANASRIAQSPVPANGDEHVNAEAGGTSLTWNAPQFGSVANYEVFFSPDFNAVRYPAVGHGPLLGTASGTTLVWNGPADSHATYFWRVDVLDAAGNRTKGTVWSFRPRHPAFRGAEGYGRFARGGRDGRVVEVTSLADYTATEPPIPGTFRYSIEVERGPRTIVFQVSGLITLTRRLSLNNDSPYVTIAGQTAPGKGICLKQFPLGLSGARDVIVRFIRNRPGSISGETIDGGGLAGSDHSIMDHCSISWSLDEAFSSRNAKNITLQRTLISEALNIAGHQNYPAGTRHGYAASIGGDIATFHHNLLAHCEGRNWSLAGGLDGAGNFAGRLDIRNNVVYNWRSRATDGGAREVNFVGNYYKAGPATTFLKCLNAQYESFPGTQQYWFDGNVLFRNGTETTDQNSLKTYSGTPNGYNPWVTAPFFPDFVTNHTAAAALRHVLCDSGCNQPLDEHDLRVIRETRDGTSTYSGSVSGSPGLPDSQVDVGGWENYGSVSRPAGYDTDHDGMPDVWETAHGYSATAANNNADPDGDGYTQLEDYLDFLAGPHGTTGQNTPLDISLTPYAGAFTAAAVVSLGNPVNGTVALLPDGRTARFTPGTGFSGTGGFSFSVTEGGFTVPQSINVLVTSQVVPEVTFASVQFTGGILTTTLLSTPGFSYQLQASASLETSSWENVGSPVAGTGTLITLSDAAAGAMSRRFYRAVVTVL